MTTPCLPGLFAPAPPVTATHRPAHDGRTYDAAQDHARLNAQTLRVWTVLQAGAWWTLAELSAQTGDPEASVSARLRDLRKPKFGGHHIERARVATMAGLFMYRLVPRQAWRSPDRGE